MKDKVARFTPSELELKMASRLYNVRYLPASFDKRFGKGIHAEISHIGISEKQREFLPIIFRKYRRQIKDAHQLMGDQIISKHEIDNSGIAVI